MFALRWLKCKSSKWNITRNLYFHFILPICWILNKFKQTFLCSISIPFTSDLCSFKCKRRTEADHPIWRPGGRFIHMKSQLHKKKAHNHEYLVPPTTKKRRDRLKAQWQDSYVVRIFVPGHYLFLEGHRYPPTVRSRKTVRSSEQITPADKNILYPSVFWRQMDRGYC